MTSTVKMKQIEGATSTVAGKGKAEFSWDDVQLQPEDPFFSRSSASRTSMRDDGLKEKGRKSSQKHDFDNMLRRAVGSKRRADR